MIVPHWGMDGDEIMKTKISFPKDAEKAIIDILGRENDVLIKYRKNKGEIEILGQTVSAKNKFIIKTE